MGVKMHHLLVRVYAGVGAPGSCEVDRLSGNARDRRFHARLQGTPIALYLPAVERAAIVFDAERKAALRSCRGVGRTCGQSSDYVNDLGATNRPSGNGRDPRRCCASRADPSVGFAACGSRWYSAGDAMPITRHGCQGPSRAYAHRKRKPTRRKLLGFDRKSGLPRNAVNLSACSQPTFPPQFEQVIASG